MIETVTENLIEVEATLQAHRLSLQRGPRAVLRAVDCRFTRGWTCVVGPNGAGKSTLLRVLAGLCAPDAGTVHLHGRPLGDYAVAERGRRIAWLAQQGDAMGDAGSDGMGQLTARDTVALGRLPHLGLFGAPGPADDAVVDRAMAATGCTAWQHRRLPDLSGGERQRVLLARALATEAPVLLLDEPTTHLDPPHQVALARLCRELGATRTVVSVLHDLPLALQADRLLVLRDGAVAAEGAWDDPALHAALVACFGGAIRIVAGPAGATRPVVTPAFE